MQNKLQIKSEEWRKYIVMAMETERPVKNQKRRNRRFYDYKMNGMVSFIPNDFGDQLLLS